MNLLNLSHALTEDQRSQIAKLVGTDINVVAEIEPQFDVEQAFVPQVVAMLDTLDIDTQTWQGEPWLIVLPSLNFIAGVLLAELHARMGHFPAIVRLRPIHHNFATQYAVTEIIDLEQVRQDGRKRR